MAEQIVNEFTVNRPIDEAWPIICDIEKIAPCLPGAQLEEIEGDVYRGRVKVKLGAITAQFKGEARMTERDDTAHKAKLVAKGRDTGGRGNAEADIHAEAEALSPTSTKCTVIADLHITGKVAQFGRGIMGDVSKKLMDQFAANLNTMLDEQGLDATVEGAAESAGDQAAGAAPTAEASTDGSASEQPSSAPSGGASSGAAAGGAASAAGAAAGGAAGAVSTGATSGVRKINGPAAEPVDLAGMAGPAVLKRLAPVLLAALLLVLLIRRRK